MEPVPATHMRRPFHLHLPCFTEVSFVFFLQIRVQEFRCSNLLVLVFRTQG
jgi:hypothetical protein